MSRYHFILTLIAVMAVESLSQTRWVPFLQQNEAPPSVVVIASTNNNVSFSVKVNGMSVVDQAVGEKVYQRLLIPDAAPMHQEGLPQVPVFTKLIAIPDCDHVFISESHSNELTLQGYQVPPAPRIEKRKSPDGSESSAEVFEESGPTYASSNPFPGKHAEIVETGYVRGQKVARVAIYPIQFSPAGKALSVFTNFEITLTFINPTSQVNKELGIFRNIMNHAALNYALDGVSASTKIGSGTSGGALGKITTGSVTRVTNLGLLVGASAIPVDYLIVTHSSLYNSSYLTTLANHRRDLNGYDVVICQVDASGSNNDIYDYEDTPGHIKYPSTPSTRYVSVRNFIADVYTNGKANHMGDGHLGYILLVGDAFLDDNSTTMVPAAYPPTYSPPYYDEYEQGGDYYYACTGGDSDDLLDVMYGRLSVSNESKLTANVNKIISYEANTNGSWGTDYTFVAFSPDLYPYADPAIALQTQIVAASYAKSYAYRAYDTSPASVVTGANPVFGQRFTLAQYNDPGNLCGADLLDTWVYSDATAGINNRLHTFVYEGHGGPQTFGAEGSGRRIFYIDRLESNLTNDLYTFMIFNCCETGMFDYISSGTIKDCLAEAFVNIANKGAIGVLASTRESWASGLGVTDLEVLRAMHCSLSHVMGEAVMESKLRIGNPFRRQFNLYGDPAVDLWPTGQLTLSGYVTFTQNVTIAAGTTLTIQPGTTMHFSPNTSLTVYGKLVAQGTSSSHIRFSSNNNASTWSGIVLSGSGANNSIFDYVDIDSVLTYGGSALNVYGATGLTFTHSTISHSSNYSTTGLALTNAGSPEIAYSTISGCGSYGISYYNTGGYLYANGIDFNTSGGVTLNCSSPSFGKLYFPAYNGNNTIQGGTYAIYAASNSYPYVGSQYNSYYGYNNIIGGSSARIYATGSCDVMAEENWWGTPYPAPGLFQAYNSSTIDKEPRLYSQVGSLRRIAAGTGQDSTVHVQAAVQVLPDSLSALRKAWEFLAQGKAKEAAQLFQSVATAAVIQDEIEEAMVGLVRTFDQTHDGSLLSFCQSPALTARVSEDFQTLMIGKMLVSQGAYAQAATQFSSLALKAQGPLLKSALLDLVALAVNGSVAGQAAEDALSKLETLYGSKDNDLMQARWVWGLIKQSQAGGALAPNQKPLADKTTPTSVDLSAAFPNPFNPTTTIRYGLPARGHVSIEVFNILGQKVAELVNNEVDAGYHAVQFDANRLASGVYFAQMRVTDELGRLIYNKVNKLLLTK